MPPPRPTLPFLISTKTPRLRRSIRRERPAYRRASTTATGNSCFHALAELAVFGLAAKQGHFHRDDVYMPITPMFHVHAWGFPWAATLAGVKQVYPGRYDPALLIKLIKSEGVTFTHGVPTILKMLLDAATKANVDLAGLEDGDRRLGVAESDRQAGDGQRGGRVRGLRHVRDRPTADRGASSVQRPHRRSRSTRSGFAPWPAGRYR